MDIAIDYNFLQDLAGLPPHILAWWVFWDFYGWVPFSIAFLWAASYLWLKSRWIKFYKQQKFILLAIDIPRDNRQTPKAVENIFSYLAGAHGSISFIEKWWEGRYQLSMCLEIVSIDGYIQFLIHTPEQFRNLVESAVYSQYPDAEITEVNDYTEGMPTQFPDDEWDIWGCEFIQKLSSAYPIKTYKEFEHQMGAPETQYKDTMASLMDLGSSLGKGEQLWFQILLTPIGFEWPEIGDKEISKIIGEKTKAGYNIIDTALDTLGEWFGYFRDEIFGGATAEDKKKEEMAESFKMWNLKPKERKQIDAIQEKVSKLGFDFKMRFIYLAKKEVINKPKVCNGFVGFIKQFTAMDLNQLKPDLKKTATRANYFFKNYIINAKKRKIMIGYKDRDDNIGRKPGILNIEELATIWHFPIETVAKAPLLQKTPVRKAEAPAALPMGEERAGEELLEPIFEEEKIENRKQKTGNNREIEDVRVKGAPPGNLPVA